MIDHCTGLHTENAYTHSGTSSGQILLPIHAHSLPRPKCSRDTVYGSIVAVYTVLMAVYLRYILRHTESLPHFGLGVQLCVSK